MRERRFAHEPVITKEKGRFKPACRCGWQDAKSDSIVESQLSYSLHVGLKELERKFA